MRLRFGRTEKVPLEVNGELKVVTQGRIAVLDWDPTTLQRIADGGSARWSPSGDQISFVGPKYQAMLLELSTGKMAAIDPGFEIDSTMEWSPDASYLLIPEGEGTMFRTAVIGSIELRIRRFSPRATTI